MANEVVVPFPMLFDVDGEPLDRGYVYVGVAGLNPIANPQTVYWDEALTIPAPSIRTTSGYLVYNGAPARLYCASEYSMIVMDKNKKIVFSCLNMSGVTAGMLMTESRGTLARSMLTPTTYDVNLIRESGFYSWVNNGASNIPTGMSANDAFILAVLASPDGSGFIQQTIYDLTNGQTSTAYCQQRQSLDAGVTWSAWTSITAGFGLGANTKIISTMLQDLPSGFYAGTGITGTPVSAHYNYVIALDNTANVDLFILYDNSSGLIYTGTRNHGTGAVTWVGFDALSVSTYGIGVVDNRSNNNNATVKGGITNDNAGLGAGNSPWPGAYWGHILTLPANSGMFIVQLALNVGSGIRRRSSSDGGSTWTPWSDIDAGSVSGAGIGVVAPTPVSDCNAITLGGLYACNDSVLNKPTSAVYGGTVIHSATVNSGYCFQIYTQVAGIGLVWARSKAGGTWQTGTGTDANGWYRVWNGLDTSGQPPAPKPSVANISTSTYTVPNGVNTGMYYGTYAGACAVTLPACNSVQLGTRLTFKSTVNQTITISRAGADIIGSYAGTSFTLYAQDDYVTLEAATSQWSVVATNGPEQTSMSTALVAGSTVGNWNAMGANWLGIALAPGIYDFEADAPYSSASSGGFTMAIGVAGGLITPGRGLSPSPGQNGMVHVASKGVVISSGMTISALYNMGGGTFNLYYTAAYTYCILTARRVG